MITCMLDTRVIVEIGDVDHRGLQAIQTINSNGQSSTIPFASLVLHQSIQMP